MGSKTKGLLCLILLVILPSSFSLAQGETCANAVTVTSLPFNYSGTTCGSGNDYAIASSEAVNPNLCLYPDPPFSGQDAYIAGEEFVFEFTPTESGCYNFIHDASDGAIHIFDTCPDDPLVSCLGFRDNNIGAAVTVSANIESGNTVYIVISDRIGLCNAFDLTVESPTSPQVNDFCFNAIELQPTGSNVDATDCGEPDDWAPENYPGVDCFGDSGGWSSNENGVWFTVTIGPTSPQPFSITINNVSCVGGGELLQMGLWEDIGDCTLSESTFVNCAIGIGTVTLGPINVPEGEYHLFVDGQNGSNCTWEFESELLCDLSVSATPIDESCSGMMDGEINVVGSGGTPPLSYTIDGTPTSIPITGLSAGTYTIGVSDSGGCTDEIMVTVGAGLSPTVSATPIDESCNGAMDGEIDVVGSGGTPPLSYTIDGSLTTIPISGLSAGTYAIAVIDNNGCSDAIIVTVGVGMSPSVMATPTDESCNGAMDGEISVAGNGGTPPLSYTIDDTPTSIPITGLSAGTYTIAVSDINGCNDATMVTVGAGVSPTISATSTDESCNGAMDGEINVVGSGGTSPLSYTIDGTLTTIPITGLSAGTYTIGVSDVNGCSDATMVTVGAGMSPTISATPTEESCNGAMDGEINVVGSGGTSPLSYTIDGTLTTIPITGLSAGTYSIAVIDINGCSDAIMVTVGAGMSPTISATPTDESCDGAMDGEINVVGSGGTSSLSYTIDGALTAIPVTGLSAGNYTIAVIDINGCSNETMVTIAAPTPITLSCSATGETAPNASDGTGTIDISGGTPLYDISWTGPSSGSSTDQPAGAFIINGLAPGNYSITVTDDNGCSTQCTFIVQSVNCNASAMATLANPISCFGDCDGAIDLTITDATMPFTLVWTGPTAIGNIQNPTGLCAGDYNVTITDDNGCEFSTSLTIDQPDELIISCSATGETAPNASDGTGTVDISWGTPFYDIFWNGPSSGSSTDQPAGPFIINGLAPGNYSVTVTDDNGCPTQCTFIVQSVNCNASATATLANSISCFGDCDGAIDLTITDAAMSFTFVWTGPTVIGNVQNPTGLCAGNYNVTITDDNGCEFSTSLTIDQPDELIISCSATGETAPNASDGTGTVDISWGTPFYDIFWNGPSSGSSTDQPAGPFIINGLAPGNYSVTVTDDNGCSTQCTFIVQPVNCNASVTATLANPINCFGDCDGAIDLTITDAAMPFTFVWTGPTVIGNVQNPTGLCAGNYNVTITDDNGCEFSASLNIADGEDFPIANAGADSDINCINSTVMLDGTGSTGVITGYEWFFNNTSISTDPIFEISEGGTYTLMVNTANGCSNSDEVVINIDPSVPVADAGLDQNITCNQQTVLLDGSNSVGSDLLWAGPGITATNENDINPVVDQAGTYTLTVTNLLGCSAVDTVEVFDDTIEVNAIIQSTDNVIDCENTTIFLDGTSSEPTNGTVFSWSDLNGPIPGANSDTLLVTQSGNYTLTVLDVASGCSDTEAFDIISNNDIPVVEVNIPSLITCNFPFSLLDGTGSTTGPNILYQWFDEVGNPIPGANNITFQTNIPGTYSLLVTDNSSECTNVIEASVLSDLIPPVADAGDPQSLDCATFEVQLDGSNSSAGANITYEWITTNGNIISGLSETNPIVDAVGDYTIVVTNEENGCSSEDVVVVNNVNNAPLDILLSIFDPICFGDDNGIVLVESVVGGTPPYMYNFGNSGFTPIGQFTNLPAGSYTITVQDAQGCETETTLTITEPNFLSIDVGDDEIIQLGESVGLNAVFNIPISQIDSFSWLNAATLSCEDCFDPIAQPMETTSYEAIIYDQNGCFALDEVTVFVENDRSVYIPNAFTPNGDGINDLFTIYSGNGVKRINELRIFDRWGENIFNKFDFEPNNPAIGWDGTFRGQLMNPGVFVYWTEIEFEDGTVKQYKGDVTLLQ